MAGFNPSPITSELKTSMRYCVAALTVLGSLALFTAGCSKNESAAKVVDLQQAFQLNAAEAPGATPAAVPAAQHDQTQQMVDEAVSAIKTNGYLKAFVALKTLQTAPGLNLNQYTAVQNARLAVEHDLAAKAQAGDPAALEALKSMKAVGH